MALDAKISELPATFVVNPSDLFVIVDMSGAPTTKKISAAYLGTLAPVQSVAGKLGAVTLEIADVNALQDALNEKQPAGSYIKLDWDSRAISGDAHDYAVGTDTLLLVTASNSARITGLAGGTAASWLRIINTTAEPLTIAHQSSSSLAANRIIVPAGADHVLGENAEAGLFYDPVSSRWRLTASPSALL